MTEEELEMFQKVGILVAALEKLAESSELKGTDCQQIARDALTEFNKSE